MFTQFLSQKRGDVVQYIVVLAVIVIIVAFAFPKIKESAKCATEKTMVGITSLFGDKKNNVSEKCGGPAAADTNKNEEVKKDDTKKEERETPDDTSAEKTSETPFAGEEMLSEEEKKAMPISHIDKGSFELSCKDFHTYSEFEIPKTAPGGMGTHTIKMGNTKGWPIWVKISKQLTDNDLNITSDHSYYRLVENGQTELFHIGWQWQPATNNAPLGKAKVYFQVLCEEPKDGSSLYQKPKNPPSNFEVTSVKDTSISLKWDKVDKSSEYLLYRNDTIVYRGKGTSFEDKQLLPGTSYTYKLYTMESSETKSSRQLTQKTTGESPLPPTPTDLRTIAVTEDVIYFRFNQSHKTTNYHIYFNGKHIVSTPWGVHLERGLTPDTTYVVTMQGENAYGKSDFGTYTFKTNGFSLVKDPTNFRLVDRTTNSLKIAWDAVPGATGYRLINQYGLVYEGPNLTYTQTNMGVGASSHFFLYTIMGNQQSNGTQATWLTLGLQSPAVPIEIKYHNVTNTSLQLKWIKGAYAETTQILLNGKEVYNGKEDTFTLDELKPNTAYTLTMRSLNANGKSMETTFQVTTKNDTYDATSQLNASCQSGDNIQTFQMPNAISGGEAGVFALQLKNNSSKDITFEVKEIEEKGSLFDEKLIELDYDKTPVILKSNDAFIIPFRWYTKSGQTNDYANKKGEFNVVIKATC